MSSTGYSVLAVSKLEGVLVVTQTVNWLGHSQAYLELFCSHTMSCSGDT